MPLPELILTYYHLDPQEQTSEKINVKYEAYHLKKCI